MTAVAGSPFVFLDRDGTLVRDTGYVHRLEDYELLPGVVEGLTRLAAAGFAFAIVTNQSGIGRGYYTAASFDTFQQHLLHDLERHGIAIRASYHCPHRPEEGCACRKPGAALLWRARDELDADLARSWLVGDGEGDVGAARAAGCAGAVRLVSETHSDALKHDGVEVARDLREAADRILAARP